MSVYKRGPHWWYRFMIDGERYSHPCGRHIKTRRAAKRIENEMRTMISAGEAGPARKPPRLCEFAPHFLEYVDAATDNNRLQPKTMLYYKRGVRLLQSTSLWDMRLDRITSEDVDRAAFRRRDNGELLGPSSCNGAIRTLRRMLKTAETRGLIHKLPQFHFYEENERDEIIEPWLEDLMLECSSSTLRQAITLAIDGGMRASEICMMRWVDVHLNSTSPCIFITKSKSKKGRRRVGISLRMRTVLEARRDNGSEWVFPSTGGKGQQPALCGHLLPTSLNRMWRKMKTRVIEQIQIAKLPPWPEGLVFHSCRHTGATRYHAAVGNDIMTANFVGHADTQTTRRYVHHQTDSGKVMDRYNENRLQSLNRLKACPFCGRNAEVKPECDDTKLNVWWVR